jgi:hypothetical protein
VTTEDTGDTEEDLTTTEDTEGREESQFRHGSRTQLLADDYGDAKG